MSVRQCLAHVCPTATVAHRSAELEHARLLLWCASWQLLLPQRLHSAITPRAPLAHNVYVQLLQIAAHQVEGSQVKGVAVSLAAA